MTAITLPARRLDAGRITGYVLTGLFVLFMAFDITIKLIGLPIVATTMAALGWPP